MTFGTGLGQVGRYLAYLLENDSYNILAGDPFAVAQLVPRVASTTPAANAANCPPVPDFTAQVVNAASRLAPASVRLSLDGTVLAHQLTTQGDQVTVSYTADTLLAPNSQHTFVLTFQDDAAPANTITQEVPFTVAIYTDIQLPAPLFLEDFNQTAEGELPPGWAQESYTDTSLSDPSMDFENLDSAAYATWTTVNADRFRGPLVGYSNPAQPTTDYQRVLSVNPRNVVNGRFVRELAAGRMAFATSGYRLGRSQVDFLFSPDFNLTGKSDIFLSFHSLYEQNQDAIGAVEYSVDQGQTWRPVVYYLDGPVVLKTPDGQVDAVATFSTAYTDVARYTDPISGEERGGTYGAFIAAPISANLAPFISARVNDDSVESKRVELFRLPGADNQARVRLRFAYAGTDSWYFGLDDVGLYSITVVTPPTITSPPRDTTVIAGNPAQLTVVADGTPPLTYQWLKGGSPVAGATGSTLTIDEAQPSDAGGYSVRVTNNAGSRTSDPVTLTVTPRPAAVFGLWNFDGNLTRAAGVGSLDYADGAVTEGLTQFEVSDGLNVPHIGGQPARYMRVPAFAARENGYALTMPTEPNGTGGYVNQYTMVFDVLIPSALNWTPFFNTEPSNGNDADFYAADDGSLGIGALGYSAAGTVESDRWHRVAFAANLTIGKVTYYVDGQPVRTRTGNPLLDGRFALYSGRDEGPDLRLFNEPSGSYTHEILVNSFFFIDRALDAVAMQGMGGPSAGGIPAPLAPPTLQFGVQGLNLNLSWTAAPGLRLQRTTSLGAPNWQDVPGTVGNGNAIEPLTGATAFYRLVLP